MGFDTFLFISLTKIRNIFIFSCKTRIEDLKSNKLDRKILKALQKIERTTNSMDDPYNQFLHAIQIKHSLFYKSITFQN